MGGIALVVLIIVTCVMLLLFFIDPGIPISILFWFFGYLSDKATNGYVFMKNLMARILFKQLQKDVTNLIEPKLPSKRR